jgi:hypothetical protein
VALFGLVACHQDGTGRLAAQAGGELASAGGGGDWSIVLVGSPEDCFSCKLQGVFVALRASQRADSALRPRVALVLITRSSRDTGPAAWLLRREHVIAAIAALSPEEAREHFDLTNTPAIYLLNGGEEIKRWEAGNGSAVAIGRDDPIDALLVAKGSGAD